MYSSSIYLNEYIGCISDTCYKTLLSVINEEIHERLEFDVSKLLLFAVLIPLMVVLFSGKKFT